MVPRTTVCPLALLVSGYSGCKSDHGLISRGLSLREVGIIPDRPGAGGRDAGCSIGWGGHSVWIFGDTFFADAARDGYHWRASTWSWTDDLEASDGSGSKRPSAKEQLEQLDEDTLARLLALLAESKKGGTPAN